MDKKAVSLPSERVVEWLIGIAVFASICFLFYLLWGKLNLGLGFIKGFR